MKKLPTQGIVKINVGGSIYTTTINTLKKCPYFNTLIEQKLTTIFIDNAYFVDRNGLLFGYILEYLRKNTIHLWNWNPIF